MEKIHIYGNACARGTRVIALLTETARRGQEEQSDKLSTTQQQDEKNDDADRTGRSYFLFKENK